MKSIKLPLYLSVFHKFTNHSYDEIDNWLNDYRVIKHYIYVWPKFLNHNVISGEMTLIEANSLIDIFKASDGGQVNIDFDKDESKIKEFYDECKKVLNYPTYLSKKLTDLDNLFIRPIFTSDLREINYEVTSWYNTQKTNYDKFKDIIDLL